MRQLLGVSTSNGLQPNSDGLASLIQLYAVPGNVSTHLPVATSIARLGTQTADQNSLHLHLRGEAGFSPSAGPSLGDERHGRNGRKTWQKGPQIDSGTVSKTFLVGIYKLLSIWGSVYAQPGVPISQQTKSARFGFGAGAVSGWHSQLQDFSFSWGVPLIGQET